MHHSTVHDEADSNFLLVWDRLFGTYRQLPRAELDRLIFGVRELAPADALKLSAMIMTPRLLRRPRSSG